MKFKTILLMGLMIGLNLYGFEPLTPGKATKKAYSEYGQVDTGVWCNADYGNDSIPPSFACYDAKGKYKFKPIIKPINNIVLNFILYPCLYLSLFIMW